MTATTTNALGSTAEIVATFQSARFAGHESQSAEGEPRWLGHRSTDRASVVIVGDPVVTEITTVVIAGPRGTRLALQLLNMYAPGSASFFREVMERGAREADSERQFGDRIVRVQAATGGDTGRVTVTVRWARGTSRMVVVPDEYACLT